MMCFHPKGQFVKNIDTWFEEPRYVEVIYIITKAMYFCPKCNKNFYKELTEVAPTDE